jgi:hypothetical protein
MSKPFLAYIIRRMPHKHKIVFSNGEWVYVNIPANVDPCWMTEDIWYYATVCAAALRTLGCDEKRAAVIAEAAVYKRIYKDMVYDAKLEEDISSVF